MKTVDTLQGGTPRRIAAMRAYRDRWNADAGRKARGALLADGMAGILQARGHGIGKIAGNAHGLADAIASARERMREALETIASETDAIASLGMTGQV